MGGMDGPNQAYEYLVVVMKGLVFMVKVGR